MEKFKLFRLVKKNIDEELKREKGWNDRFYVKENHTPNRIPQNQARTHIKIKSRDIKKINLNIFTEEKSKQKINTTSYLNTENKIIHFQKLKPNKTLNTLLSLKLHKKEKKKNNIKTNLNNDNNNEILKKINNLWEELGVNYIYQRLFNSIINNLDKETRENYYLYEYNKLNNIYNIINIILNDINNRDKIIFKLRKKYENKENEDNIYNNSNFDDKIIQEVLSDLIDLRKYSIDIVNNIILLRKEIYYDIIMNKYDINKICIFPQDYLVKMYNDLDFLINTRLNKYFNFSNADPFLKKINICEHKYNLPEIKEDNKIYIINNYKNILLDELISQEFNLKIINSKDSLDSIYNFTSKNKILKKNYTTINSRLISNKNDKNDKNKIIKANRGLSRQKLRPKISNKIIIDADISDISKTQAYISSKKLNNIKSKTINYKDSNKKLFIHGKDKNILTEDDENKEYNNINQKIIEDDDLRIFEKYIEKIIMDKNNIDKDLYDNKIQMNKIEKYPTKNIKKEKIISNNIKSKECGEEELDLILDDNNENNSLTKNEKLKKQVSDFINDLFIESEIENNQKIGESKNKVSKLNNNENDYILDDSEIEVDSIKKEYTNYIIELYKDKLSSLKDIYKNYYEKIPKKFKIGFNINSNIINYLQGIYPKILLIKSTKNNSQIIGIVTLSYIAYNSNNIVLGKMKSNNYNKMLCISSISSIDESLFSDILVNTIDFCEEFFNFENIILQLYYLNKNGQFILYSDLEKIIKEKAKFRWVNMENDGIDRKIKYKYINTNYNINKNNFEYTNNIINLRSLSIIGYESEKNYNNMDIRQLSFINDFSINYLLIEMIGQHNFKVADKKNEGNNFINSLIKKVTFKKINHLSSDFLMSQVGEASDIKDFIKENEEFLNNNEIIEKIDQKIYYELFFSSAIININNSFKNIIKRKYKGYLYNILFNDNINEFTIKDNNNKDMKFYLIKSYEQNTSIIIYELEKNKTLEDIQKILFNTKNNNKNANVDKNISEIFKEIYSKVTKKPDKINKSIYIPSFKIFSNQMVYRPSVFSGVTLENEKNDKNLKIDCLDYIEELTFGIDEPFTVQQNVMDLDDDFEDSIIIKNDFIISVVDNDLIFELQIPIISAFHVLKSNWIKYS